MTKIIDTDTQDIKSYVLDICYQMNKDKWIPDYVVGIPRGGLLPAVMFSHFLNRPMVIQDVRLRDNVQQESNSEIPLDVFCKISENVQNHFITLNPSQIHFKFFSKILRKLSRIFQDF